MATSPLNVTVNMQAAFEGAVGHCTHDIVTDPWDLQGGPQWFSSTRRRHLVSRTLLHPKILYVRSQGYRPSWSSVKIHVFYLGNHVTLSNSKGRTSSQQWRPHPHNSSWPSPQPVRSAGPPLRSMLLIVSQPQMWMRSLRTACHNPIKGTSQTLESESSVPKGAIYDDGISRLSMSSRYWRKGIRDRLNEIVYVSGGTA